MNPDIANLQAFSTELKQLGASCAAVAANIDRVVQSATTPIKSNAGYFVTENAVNKFRAELQALRLNLKQTASNAPVIEGHLARIFTSERKKAA